MFFFGLEYLNKSKSGPFNLFSNPLLFSFVQVNYGLSFFAFKQIILFPVELPKPGQCSRATVYPLLFPSRIIEAIFGLIRIFPFSVSN